ncbi:hypothetical protein PROFUN_09505 [Planoprotostelium fungivorum]|uniref:Ubiquitin-like domain-containing protein n=1 Tax=Planoprotostelium fungivorum TaxID=1890364 RepID=A0A2P6NH64_9EUKA|nr:hypothetical protein PROFUN_09505 [Planoprotostelium fungivorum]
MEEEKGAGGVKTSRNLRARILRPSRGHACCRHQRPLIEPRTHARHERYGEVAFYSARSVTDLKRQIQDRKGYPLDKQVLRRTNGRSMIEEDHLPDGRELILSMCLHGGHDCTRCHNLDKSCTIL